MIQHERSAKWLHLAALVVASLAGGAVVLAATSRYGPAVGPDSAAYLSTARNLAVGQGFRSYYAPLTAWPPLLPLLLALPVKAGADPLTATRWLNAFAFGLTVLVIGVWVKSATGRLWLALTGQLLVLQAAPVLFYDWLMTEPIFLTLTTLLLWRLRALVRADRRTWRSVWVVAVLASLAWLTRYTGVAAVAAAGLTLLLTSRMSWRRRLAEATVFAAVTCLPMAAWVVRNYRLSGLPFGYRPPAHGVFWQNVTLTAGTIGRWLWPGPGFERVPSAAAGWLLAAGVVLGVVWLVRFQWKTFIRPGGQASSDAAVPAFYVLLYLAALIASTSRYINESIGDRYVGPIYPALVVLAMLGIGLLARAGRSGPGPARWRRAGLSAAMAWAAAIVVIGLIDLSGRLAGQVRDGAGAFSTTRWQESDLARGLRSDPLPGGRILSNEPHAAYLLLGRPVMGMPGWDAGTTKDRAQFPQVVAKYDKGIQAQPTYLVIWNAVCYDNQVPLGELARFWRLTPIRRFNDGVIFRVTVRDRVLPGPPTQPDQ
jgi:hypothetical protein